MSFGEAEKALQNSIYTVETMIKQARLMPESEERTRLGEYLGDMRRTLEQVKEDWECNYVAEWTRTDISRHFSEDVLAGGFRCGNYKVIQSTRSGKLGILIGSTYMEHNRIGSSGAYSLTLDEAKDFHAKLGKFIVELDGQGGLSP